MYTDENYTKLRNVEYNKKQIKKIKKKFRGLSPKDINIFWDMDNTLFIFSKNSDDKKSLKMQENEGFFRDLEAMDGGPEVVEELEKMGFNVFILSACCNDTTCPKEKYESIKINYPSIKDENIIFVMNGENKAEKIKSLGLDINRSILVDDYYANLMAWLELGGLAIKKTFSGKKRPIPQIKDFHEIYGILEEVLG